MILITSLEDGRMNMFRSFAKSAAGFVGYEKLLYLSLVAALERVKELEHMVDDSEAEKMGYATELANLKGATSETGDESTG